MSTTKRDIDSPPGVLAGLCRVAGVCAFALFLLAVASAYLWLMWMSAGGGA